MYRVSIRSRHQDAFGASTYPHLKLALLTFHYLVDQWRMRILASNQVYCFGLGYVSLSPQLTFLPCSLLSSRQLHPGSVLLPLYHISSTTRAPSQSIKLEIITSLSFTSFIFH